MSETRTILQNHLWGNVQNLPTLYEKTWMGYLEINALLKYEQSPAYFLFILVFSNKLQNKNCRLRTRIVRVEGEHADHLTTTTAQQ